tara:strand:- start:249 stop:1148 length:900 start_codon:yes stop_codon:yes gene_type:complete
MNIQPFYDLDRLYQIRYNPPDDTVHFYNAGEEDMYKNYTGQFAPRLIEGAFTRYKREDVVYNLNNLQFRTKPLEQIEKVDLLVLGCSHTFGVGLPQEHIWHHQLADELKISHDAICNLGVPAMGPNFVKDALTAYVASEMPRPKRIAILWPNMYRIELALGQNNNNICVFGDYELDYKDKGKTKAWKIWENDNPKLWHARQQACEYHAVQCASMMNSELIQITWTEELNDKFVFDTQYKHRARDLMHMDKKQHGEIARMFIDRFGVSGSTAVSKTEGGGSIPPTGAKKRKRYKTGVTWM